MAAPSLDQEIRLNRKSPPAGKVSFEEFLAWADEDTCAEWEDGEVIMASLVSVHHQEILSWLGTILHLFVRQRNQGRILARPFLVHLLQTDQGREPDILFVKKEHEDRLHGTFLEGPPDIAVEIVSPESVARDRGRKFIEYEKEGIQEYWLIDPLRDEALFYRLGANRRYHLAPLDSQGIFHSAALEGFRLNSQWLWQKPLPNELEILRGLTG